MISVYLLLDYLDTQNHFSRPCQSNRNATRRLIGFGSWLFVLLHYLPFRATLSMLAPNC